MQNNIQTLYTELKEKVNPARLKDISIDIISKFKNRDHEYFIQFAKLIGIDSFNENLNRIFAKIIQIYHPDKFNIIKKELESVYKSNNYDDLLRLKNIYLIDLSSLQAAISYGYIEKEDHSYTEDEFGYAEYDFDGEDIFTDAEYDDTVEEHADPYAHGFAEAINKYFVGNLDYTLSRSDLRNIDGELDLSDYEINDLAGIENCINTNVLNLSGNEIIKIHQLSALVKLKALFLSQNSIEDISYLKSLTELEELDISFNSIEDISVLLELPKLKYVNVIHNPINNKSVINKLLKNGVIVIN
jgi:Leucine-rich repeat (LRR) protein